ncbi:MAG: sigma-70 family RNA polymerase sigma factor [Planctomycetes bacterium]|nr:sigma-70 family RNA polymerase sigma factor [Planctomycetota bacterium]
MAACRDPGGDGFHDAFEVVFHRYRERVYAIAYRISGNASDAMDIVQESFALLFRKLGSFKGNALFSTWLFRIVANCSIDYRRRNKTGRGPSLLSDHGDGVDVADESLGPRDVAAVNEVGDQVQAAISKLSPKLRAIMALRYLEEMSYEQLASTLELSMGTVKSRLARAHLALEHVVRTRFPHLDVSKKLAAQDAADGRSEGDQDPVGGVG